MLRFLAGRVLQSLLILLGVTMVTFGLLFLVPADPVRMIAGRSAAPETVESIRRQLGLDQPIPVQYLRYIGDLIQGDLGRSHVQKAEVTELVASRLPATLQLMVAAVFFELLLGLPADIYAATRRNRGADRMAGLAEDRIVGYALQVQPDSRRLYIRRLAAHQPIDRPMRMEYAPQGPIDRIC